MREQIDEALAGLEEKQLAGVTKVLKECADLNGKGPLKRLAGDAGVDKAASGCGKKILEIVGGTEEGP
jgi:hypothetical protein